MNREILFRAKPCYIGGNKPTWVYGTFQYIAQRRINQNATDNGTLEVRTDKGRIIDLYGTKTEVLYDTLGQFTGMRDMRGKKIFEGDVVRRKDSAYGMEDTGVVKYDCHLGAFVLECNDNGRVYRITFKKGFSDNDGKCTIEGTYFYEVIGNVHNNPELLSTE